MTIESDLSRRSSTPSACSPGHASIAARRCAALSMAARAQVPGWVRRRYGSGDRDVVDLFVPVESLLAPVPILVYFGGGQWDQPASSSSFPAPGLVDMGIAFAAVDVDSRSPIDLLAMIEQATQAVEWIALSQRALGLDPARMVLAGSGWGAHLAAMVTLATRQSGMVSGAVLMSGSFDLAALSATRRGRRLALDVVTAEAMTPALYDLAGFPRAVIAVGDGDRDSIRHQSEVFARRLKTSRSQCTLLTIADRHECDLVFDLSDPSSVLGTATLELLR